MATVDLRLHVVRYDVLAGNADARDPLFRFEALRRATLDDAR
jgi:hypothetical protein